MPKTLISQQKGISIWLERTEQGIQLGASGPLAPLCSPLLKMINARLKYEKPIAVEKDKAILSTWLPPIPSGPFKRLIAAEIDILLRRYYRPQAISINASKRCLCKCEKCNMARSPEPELSIDELKRFISQVIDLGAITIGLAEGDPLLRDDTVELVNYVDKEKSIVSIFTPGLLVTEDLAEELKKAGLYAMIIGFCSPIASEHDEIRKLKGAFRKAVQSIKNALQAGIYVSIHCHANPWLIETGRLEGLYKLATDLRVQELTIWESIPTWYYRDKEEIMLNDAHREYLLSLYRKINSSPVGPRIFLMTSFEGPNFLGCMAGRRWLNLVDSGDITPCIYTPISFGNIREEKASTIWSRIRKHPLYKRHKPFCMMLDSSFRKRYIEKIPEGTRLPIRIEELEKVSTSKT